MNFPETSRLSERLFAQRVPTSGFLQFFPIHFFTCVVHSRFTHIAVYIMSHCFSLRRAWYYRDVTYASVFQSSIKVMEVFFCVYEMFVLNICVVFFVCVSISFSFASRILSYINIYTSLCIYICVFIHVHTFK